MKGKMETKFPHRHSAHCESGVTSNLMRYQGFEISEAMSFGIGSGLFFGYLPFLKVNDIPLTTYRIIPGGIFKRATSRLGVKVRRQRFRNPEKGMQVLDELIAQGIPVGVQVGAYWLPFFPPALRFHFNAHNLVVYGKRGEEYLISDPVFDEPVTCPYEDLLKARFSKGPLAPKGHLYYLLNKPDRAFLKDAIGKGIKEVCNKMLGIPIPLLGVKGMRYLAKRLRGWPEQLGPEKANQYLGFIIRAQEEIGTGGAGFRFIYAAFLQEVAEILNKDELLNLSEELTQIGDRWREFALGGARNCKGKATSEESYPKLAEILMECADREEQIFRSLRSQIIS